MPRCQEGLGHVILHGHIHHPAAPFEGQGYVQLPLLGGVVGLPADKQGASLGELNAQGPLGAQRQLGSAALEQQVLPQWAPPPLLPHHCSIQWPAIPSIKDSARLHDHGSAEGGGGGGYGDVTRGELQGQGAQGHREGRSIGASSASSGEGRREHSERGRPGRRGEGKGQALSCRPRLCSPAPRKAHKAQPICCQGAAAVLQGHPQALNLLIRQDAKHAGRGGAAAPAGQGQGLGLSRCQPGQRLPCQG